MALVSMFLCNQSYASHGRDFLLWVTILNSSEETVSIVVFITSIVGSFKGALVTEIIREKRDALVFEEASWWRVLKSREPGLSLALLPSRLTLSLLSLTEHLPGVHTWARYYGFFCDIAISSALFTHGKPQGSSSRHI